MTSHVLNSQLFFTHCFCQWVYCAGLLTPGSDTYVVYVIQWCRLYLDPTLNQEVLHWHSALERTMMWPISSYGRGSCMKLDWLPVTSKFCSAKLFTLSQYFCQYLSYLLLLCINSFIHHIIETAFKHISCVAVGSQRVDQSASEFI